MAKKSREKRKGLMDLLVSQEWIASLEKRFEKRLKSAKDTFDRNLEKAKKGLNITTRRDLNAIHSRIRALEKRLEKLEGLIKAAPSRPRTSNDKE
jgi:polyhydroxyalkanoate synthesis regulator phasin